MKILIELITFLTLILINKSLAISNNETDNYLVTGKFKYCHGFKKNEEIDYLDANTCKSDNDMIENASDMMSRINIRNVYGAIILNKYHENIYGMGYECEQEKVIYKFDKTFFLGTETINIEKELYVLSADECWKMVKEKRCIGYSKGEVKKTMKCVNEACFYDEKPIPEYSRGFTVEKTTLKCQFKTKLIEGINKETPIFKTDTGCLYKQMFCDLSRSIVVWNSSVYHECPYEYVATMTLFRYDDLLFFNAKENSVFQIKIKEMNSDNLNGTVCSKFTTYPTEQGLYLTFTKVDPIHPEEKIFKTIINYENETSIMPFIERLSKSTSVINTKMDLEISANDGAQFAESLLQNSIDKQLCKNNIILIKTAMQNNKQDEFLTIKDNDGQDIVLFIHNKFVFQATCSIVENIYVRKYMDKCYNDLQVIFKINNQTITGFYDGIQNLINPFTSINQNCNDGNNKYHIVGSNIFIQTNNNITVFTRQETGSNKKIKLAKLVYNNKSYIFSSRKNFEHLRILTDNIDLYTGVFGLSSSAVEEIDIFNRDSVLGMETDKTTTITGFKDFIISIRNFFGNAIVMIISWAIVILIIIFGIWLIPKLSCLRSCLRKICSKKEKRNQKKNSKTTENSNESDIEMGLF